MAVNWSEELLAQLDWYWANLFRPRLEGLTDEEYFWEPVPNCWTVRRQPDGHWAPDYIFPEPKPAPVTTIAWRLCHIGGPVLAWRNAKHFCGEAFDIAKHDWPGGWPGSAAEAIAWVERGYATWKAGVSSLDGEALATPVGAKEPFPDAPMAALVLHINREFIHHGAEVALLRDLYRARFGAT
jgi:hypothetical protein